MATAFTEEKLRGVRAGDRIQYHGVQWQIEDYSTYTDDKGYETEEWQLKSSTGKIYYLLREIDPANPEGLVHWFLAEEVRNPVIYEPESFKDVTLNLSEEMRSHKPPYPTLQLFNRVYTFESATEGVYEAEDDVQTRTTWDYWDEPHLWNLALEAWPRGPLVVYSTRQVQPTDFTEMQPGGIGFQKIARAPTPLGWRSWGPANNSRSWKLLIAWTLTVLGFILMCAGI